MSQIEFDPTGAINPDYGVQVDQLVAIYPRLETLRREIVEEDPRQYNSGDIPDHKRPLDARFAWLPEELLSAYGESREASELGRIFSVSQFLHDQVDAVAVLGIGGSYMGARALMDACCHPYHNELSRGGRGGKPRMYFEGNNVDNDASAALMERLSISSGENSVDDRFATVVISKSGGTMETAVAFREFLRLMEKQLGGESAEVGKYVVPVTGASGKLFDLAAELGCQQVFAVPDGVGGRF